MWIPAIKGPATTFPTSLGLGPAPDEEGEQDALLVPLSANAIEGKLTHPIMPPDLAASVVQSTLLALWPR